MQGSQVCQPSMKNEINNCYSYVDSIHPRELEIKDSKESKSSVSYLDILLEKDITGNLTLNTL